MPDVSKLSRYIKVENVKDGDIIRFIDAGVIVEKDFKGQKKNALEITVNFRGENKTYSPNGTTVKLLSAAWGQDTGDWVGQSAVLNIMPSSAGKDMIIAKPVKNDIL